MKHISTILETVKAEFETGVRSSGETNIYIGLCEAADSCFNTGLLTLEERRVFEMVWITYAYKRKESVSGELFYSSHEYRTTAIIFGWKTYSHIPRIEWLDEQIEFY